MNKPIDLVKMAQESAKGAIKAVKGADSAGHKPELMDIVGAEKYLQVQGYTYYGCLYS